MQISHSIGMLKAFQEPSENSSSRYVEHVSKRPFAEKCDEIKASYTFP